MIIKTVNSNSFFIQDEHEPYQFQITVTSGGLRISGDFEIRTVAGLKEFKIKTDHVALKPIKKGGK